MAKKKEEAKKKKEDALVPTGYSVGDWSGKKRYECDYCQFDVLEDEKAMLEHLLTVHSSEAAFDALLAMENQAEAPAAEPEAPYPIQIEED
jgi:hypothetical protein